MFATIQDAVTIYVISLDQYLTDLVKIKAQNAGLKHQDWPVADRERLYRTEHELTGMTTVLGMTGDDIELLYRQARGGRDGTPVSALEPRY